LIEADRGEAVLNAPIIRSEDFSQCEPAAERDSRYVVEQFCGFHSPLYFVCVAIGITAALVNSYYLYFVPASFPPVVPELKLRFWFCCLWSIALIGELFDTLGFLAPRSKVEPPPRRRIENGQLTVRFVSRGINAPVLLHSARQAHKLLTKADRIPFSVQLVSELPLEKYFLPGEQEKYCVVPVPPDFVCKGGTLYKARGLEYARLHAPRSDLPEWVLFLDEESVLTPESIQAVCDFISDDSDRNRIAQGGIMYTNGNFARNLPIAAADLLRVGGELGRFRLQYRELHTVLFGFHGSFFVTSQDVIDRVTFDVGPKASVVEDIYFAMIASQMGVSFRYLPAYIREQSPESYFDFFKQRSRWMTGLTYFVLDGRIPLLRRLPMLVITLASRAHGLVVVAFILAALTVQLPLTRYVIFFVLPYLCVLRPSYLVGLLCTLSDTLIPRAARLKYATALIVIAPVVPLLDALVSLYVLVRPQKGFHVVRKSLEKLPAAG